MRQRCDNWPCEHDGIQVQKRMNMLIKELFRKAIHMCAALVPLLLHFTYYPAMVLLTLMLIF